MKHKPTKTRSRRWALVIVTLLLAALAAWLWPSILSLYQQERGGRLLDQALEAEGHDTQQESWPLLWETLDDREAQALTEQAAARFHAAIAAAPRHSQAHRWLGRALLLLGKPHSAAEAFSTYVNQRPDNPLGYWELGLAYHRLAQQTEINVHWQFDAELDVSPTSLVTASNRGTASLPMAEVETPYRVIETPYCEHGEAPASCFVNTTEWAMPNAPQEPLRMPNSAMRREVLFMHPPAQATFTTTLPVTPTTLTFWMGINPAVWTAMGDGVVYHVAVADSTVFTHALTIEQARQGWQPAQVDLSTRSEQTVRLTLATNPGPDDNGSGDWAGWADVRITTGETATLALLDPDRLATATWEEGGFTRQAYGHFVE